jgi:Ca2+-transporting ATPase
MKEFYQLSPDEVRKAVNGTTRPLTSGQVKEHQRKYGDNELQQEERKGPLKIFLEQFRDFLVIILIIAAIVSGCLGDWESALVILVVITMNAILGTVQTIKASQSLDSLREMAPSMAKVFREGRFVKIPAREVTVGDEVLLEAGDQVPADGRSFSVPV